MKPEQRNVQPGLFMADNKPLTPCDAVAAIITSGGRYLMQLRDDHGGIFYPDHWGLFGGGMEPGENETDALIRELAEELGLAVATHELRRFSAFRFNFTFAGASVIRVFYEVPLDPARLRPLRVREGRRMDLLTPEQALDPNRKVAPYDAFAVWVHASRKRFDFGQQDVAADPPLQQSERALTHSCGQLESRDQPTRADDPAHNRKRGARNTQQGKTTMRSSDTPISVSEYDANEAEALNHFGNDILRAYAPATSFANAYPARVRSEAELLRCIDPMLEAFSRTVDDSDQYVRQYSLRTRFTDDEVAIMQRVREKTARFCKEAFGRRVLPINSVMSAVGLFRAIKHIQKSFAKPLRVAEIGPGAGYLGAFLIASGHPYTSIDTSQSFYLWRSRLLHHFAPQGGFQEQAHAKVGKAVKQGPVTHVPWWHFVSNIGATPLRADIVVCDQALSEMHAWASRYTIFTSRDILAQSEARMFMFSDFGRPDVPHDQVLSIFSEAGYSQILSHFLYGFTPGTHQLPGAVYGLDSEIPLFNPSDGTRLTKPSSVLKTKRSEMPPDMEFRQFVNIWPHYDLFVSDGANEEQRPPMATKAEKPGGGEHRRPPTVAKAVKAKKASTG